MVGCVFPIILLLVGGGIGAAIGGNAEYYGGAIGFAVGAVLMVLVIWALAQAKQR